MKRFMCVELIVDYFAVCVAVPADEGGDGEDSTASANGDAEYASL